MGTVIVRAKPPSKVYRAPRAAAEPLAIAPEPVRTARLPEVAEPPSATALTAPRPRKEAPTWHIEPAAAMDAFRKLVAGWNLREDRAWTMLTGMPDQPRKLRADQAQRVALLVEIDAAIGSVLANVGAWMIDPNPGPLLAGRSPLDFLTRVGTPGYLSLAKQARQWAEM